MNRQHQANAAHYPETVERDLSKPLLVDPAPTACPSEERILVWKPVLDNLPAADKGQPAVLDKLLPNLKHRKQRKDGYRRPRETARVANVRDARTA